MYYNKPGDIIVEIRLDQKEINKVHQDFNTFIIVSKKIQREWIWNNKNTGE